MDARLDRLLTPEVERWAGVDLDLREPLANLQSTVLSGGKRLRPAFCYWSFVGAGGDPSAAEVIDAGAALEMLHAAALLHDDVIDGSARRHGADTVHVQFAARHRDRAWHGDPERFGAGAAILLGDLALVYSDRLLAGAPPAAGEIFDEVRLEVNVGQYLDILGAALWSGDGSGGAADEAVARAWRICRYKTAKYTVERPLHLGSALAAPEQMEDRRGPLSAFGLPLGEAFQLRDDLLGVFGDPAVTGKPVGDDLREGKPTLLASLARAGASGAGARLFAARFGAADLSEAEAVELREVIDATNARQEVESTIARLAATARDALAALPVVPEARQALEELAQFVIGRDR
ncbi:MAG TPA: polyprenyl synthetase family protein [Acidimicrobiales bacterium]